jgi:hypothetical protein
MFFGKESVPVHVFPNPLAKCAPKMTNGERNALSELFYERETEYYGMTPYALLDRVGSMIVDRYFVTLNELHNETLPKNCHFLSETQIAAALTQWSLQVEGTIDKNFELFETYIMKNILALPSDFPIDKFLEEDSGDGRQAASEKDLKNLNEQMDQLTKRLEAVREARFNFYFIIVSPLGCFEK